MNFTDVSYNEPVEDCTLISAINLDLLVGIAATAALVRRLFNGTSNCNQQRST